MENSIGKEFNFFSLIRFALPTMVMMVFISLYSVVDGVFVSNFIGTNALSAVNIAYPVLNVFIGISIMLGTGGSALIAKQMGEGKMEEARKNFSLILLVGVLSIFILGLIGLFFMKPLVYLLGATENLYDYVKDYLSILLLFAPFASMQMLFQTFFVTAGKPRIGLILTVLAGITNMILDYVFIVTFDLGISGAALATATGYLIPSIYGLYYFFKHKGNIYFVKPSFELKVISQSCLNGSSEMVSNVSVGLITLLFNIIMMRLLGEDGVAAITIILYAQFLMTAIYMGFTFGVSPVISYNFGSQNHEQLKVITKNCLMFIGGLSIIIFIISITFASQIVGIFSPRGSTVYDIGIVGFFIFAFSYLFSGLNTFSSGLFTSLSNGKISAILSFLRTFVFIAIAIFTLPAILGVNGVWLSVPIAEGLTFLLGIYFILRYRNHYHYL